MNVKIKMLYYRLLALLFGMILIAGTTAPLSATDLINYVNSPVMNEQQTHYYDVVLNEATTAHSALATINFDELKDAETVYLNLHDNLTYTATKSRDADSYASRRSWIGKIEPINGQVHLVQFKDMLTGYIHIEDMAFSIRPLTGGLHAIILHHFEKMTGCETVDNERLEPGVTREELESTLTHPDIVNNKGQDDLSASRATGECRIRYLAAYTTAAGAALADPTSTMVGATDMMNTGYANSGVVHRIELCRVMAVAYTENASQAVDRDRFRITNDGFMDNIHTERSLWNADMCGLVRSGGSGIAYIDNSFAFVFQTTDYANIPGHTWTHEIGHNHVATHDPTAGGVSPYRGWGEPTTGCFRTIMAYSSACGTGSCTRQNVLSDNSFLWNCSGTNYFPGTSTHRNADRHNLSTSTLVDHHLVSTNSTFGGDYNISNGEYVSHTASNDVGYNSTVNKFEVFNGGEAEFRASNTVTLGEGFHARFGSVFRAYRESCSSLAASPPDAVDMYKEEPQQEEINTFHEHGDIVHIYPNPFEDITNIEYTLTDAGPLSIEVFDLSGKMIASLLNSDNHPSGRYLAHFDGSELAAGTYVCRVVTNSRTETIKLMLYR